MEAEYEAVLPPSRIVFLRANFDRPNGFIGLMKLGVNFDHFEAKLASQNRFYTSLEFDSGSCILGSDPLLISTNLSPTLLFRIFLSETP